MFGSVFPDVGKDILYAYPGVYERRSHTFLH